MKQLKFLLMITVLCLVVQGHAQKAGLVNTSQSKYAALSSLNMGAVQFTKGFWADRFAICRDSMLPHLWDTYHNEVLCHSFRNFEIAAGLYPGKFRGPSFHDGDFYKTLEAVAAMYAVTKDYKLDTMMDHAIAVIAKAQKADGYIYTKSIIEQQQTGKQKMFDDVLSFEAYNFGHLMTAACVHYRATGKTSLLQVAEKAADFLIGFYAKATPEQARNAICPSHYMGLAELYRTDHQQKYLDLLVKLIDIRGTVEGTDDNSDRMPFRKMKKVVGHAVRANYLFAGVADLYAENGDKTLLTTLDGLWDNVVHQKMYVTGGAGALYDGVSVDGTSYKPDSVQKIHQAYGRDFQLPNKTAHGETCANIGNLLWNWRMLQLTADPKYAEVMELCLYNSILSGVSMNGNNYFYTNPLAASADFPYSLRWQGGRVPYISKSNCCPPNTVRTIAEVGNYLYSVSDKGLYLNIYGGNELNTQLENGTAISLTQTSHYPYDGSVQIQVNQMPKFAYGLYLRIPAWCKKATVLVNGQATSQSPVSGTYFPIQRVWKKGDQIQLKLEMPVALLESNPLVEETRNQVTVKRGPLVYCLESIDLPKGFKISDIAIPANANWKTINKKIDIGMVTGLEATVKARSPQDWKQNLYQPIGSMDKTATLQLIPYFSWANRGNTDMTVWMPLIR